MEQIKGVRRAVLSAAGGGWVGVAGPNGSERNHTLGLSVSQSRNLENLRGTVSGAVIRIILPAKTQDWTI